MGTKAGVVGWHNHGQSERASPRARSWNTRVSNRPIWRLWTRCVRVAVDQRHRRTCLLFRAAKSFMQRSFFRSPLFFLFTPLSLSLSLSLFCLVSSPPCSRLCDSWPLDSSRSPRKCLLGWKIARIPDDGRIDLVRDSRTEPKGCWWMKGWRSCGEEGGGGGERRGEVLLLDSWIKSRGYTRWLRLLENFDRPEY